MTGETYLQFNSIMYIKCYLDDNASVQCYLGWGISYDDAHNSSHGEILPTYWTSKQSSKSKPSLDVNLAFYFWTTSEKQQIISQLKRNFEYLSKLNIKTECPSHSKTSKFSTKSQ